MITIGITGHRNLYEKHLLYYRDSTRNVLKKLKNSDEEVMIYSALADGADRLVVDVANELGIDYVAVLPMPKKLYMTDFDDTSKEMLEGMLDKAVSVLEMPLVQCNTVASICKHSNERDMQYEAAGFFMSDNCNILLSLWDGVETNLRGGTGEIVKYHLSKTHYTLYHLLVSRSHGLTKDMVEFKIYEK